MLYIFKIQRVTAGQSLILTYQPAFYPHLWWPHFAFSALTLLDEVRKSIQPVKIEWSGVGVAICLQWDADRLHTVQLMLPPSQTQTPLSLASFKPRLVLPFWYWLTHVVLKKRALNGCSSSSSCGDPMRIWPRSLASKDQSCWLLCSAVCVIIHLTVWIEHQLETHRQTHDDSIYCSSTTLYGKNQG